MNHDTLLSECAKIVREEVEPFASFCLGQDDAEYLAKRILAIAIERCAGVCDQLSKESQAIDEEAWSNKHHHRIETYLIAARRIRDLALTEQKKEI